MSKCLSMHTHVANYGGQKRVSDPMDLSELQAVVSY